MLISEIILSLFYLACLFILPFLINSEIQYYKQIISLLTSIREDMHEKKE